MTSVDIGVGVLVLNDDDQVLLGKRHDNPALSEEGEAVWSMPGGSLEPGESFEEAAKRETREETGLRLHGATPVCVSNDVGEDVHFVTIGLAADSYEGTPIAKEDAFETWAWFDQDSLPENVFTPSKRLIMRDEAEEVIPVKYDSPDRLS